MYPDSTETAGRESFPSGCFYISPEFQKFRNSGQRLVTDCISTDMDEPTSFKTLHHVVFPFTSFHANPLIISENRGFEKGAEMGL